MNTVEEMEWFSQVETMRVELLAQHGLKSCIGQFMVTTPGREHNFRNHLWISPTFRLLDVTNADLIEAFYPAIDAALKYDGILGLHEYAGPFLNSSYVFAHKKIYTFLRYSSFLFVM